MLLCILLDAAYIMITKYISSVSLSFNPFKKEASKSIRIFLSLLINRTAREAHPIALSTQVLSKGSNVLNKLDILYCDGKRLVIDPSHMKINDLVVLVDRHSRMLASQDIVK